MKYTDEQKDIINFKGNSLKVEAVAGSGKSSSLKGFAEKRPQQNFLYLCFNRSVSEEAKVKFPSNVEVRTAHSLAYAHKDPDWELRLNNLQCYDIVEELDLWNHKDEESEDGKYNHFKLAQHILNKFNLYCNSELKTFEELNYFDYCRNFHAETIRFVEAHIKEIDSSSIEIFNRMKKYKMNCTHDFYLKMYQLSNPILNYDYILYDEVQDASPNMLDIFKKQECKKVCCGDTSQQIYSFRQAINALKSLDFEEKHLTNSFRFRSDIANLANYILNLKRKFNTHKNIQVIGVGGNNIENQKRAIIARSNVALFKKAIDLISIHSFEIDKIYFEGKFNNYVFCSDGSIWDIYNLYVNKPDKIRGKFIKSFEEFDDLLEYAGEHGTRDLQLMIQIVEKFKGGLPIQYNKLKSKLTEKRKEADIVFTTLHKCKGMEYRYVELVPDFITEEKLIQFDEDPTGHFSEEINCLYVAATRAIDKLVFPNNLLYNNLILNESRCNSILQGLF